MTWFHFCTANHNEIGRASLGEMAKWFEAGLLDLGHRVTFSERYAEPRAVNVFWENFNSDFNRQLRDAKVNFGIIATEIPDGAGFNWRRDGEWATRFKAFEEIAVDASFIWTTVESTVPYYSKFCPVAFVELGFSERLLPGYKDDSPAVDFIFYGIKTPYRQLSIEKIRRYAEVEWPDKFLSDDDVERLIARGKVGINFKQSERWPIPSPTRLGRLIMAKRAVAAEFVPVPTRQGELVGICPPDVEFADYALSVLSDWRGRAERAYEKFRETMLMKEIMDQAINVTLGAPLDTDDDWLVSRPALEWTPPPRLLLTVQHWNLVHWKGRYFALHKRLGEIDVTLGERALIEIYGKKYVMCSSDLTDLEKKVANFEGGLFFYFANIPYIIRYSIKKLRKKVKEFGVAN